MAELHVHTSLASRGPAAAIVLTDEQVAALGSAKAAPVVVTIGDQSIRLRLARMGAENMIGFSKAARAQLGLDIGAEIDATITIDTAERAVELPTELSTALQAEPGLRERFDALPYSARKEHARTVADAKQDATRERRLTKILESLRG